MRSTRKIQQLVCRVRRTGIGRWGPSLIKFFFAICFRFFSNQILPGVIFCRGPKRLTALPADVCREPFAVCCTRQRVCRVLLNLCLVPPAHGKKPDSRIEGHSCSKNTSKCSCDIKMDESGCGYEPRFQLSMTSKLFLIGNVIINNSQFGICP